MTKNAAFSSPHDLVVSAQLSTLKPFGAASEGAATCQTCGSLSIFYFSVLPQKLETTPVWDRRIMIQQNGRNWELAGSIPSVPEFDCPEHVDERVQRAFLEAEKSRRAGVFTAAAGLYRKTVDRAITPLIDEKYKTKQLGIKLGALEKTQSLPDVMLDWIRIVKDDGNYAMHDDDRDFETPEEIEPARKFTIALLQYLYTLPKEVADARATIEARENGD